MSYIMLRRGDCCQNIPWRVYREEVDRLLDKLPWVDTTKCNIKDKCGECKAALLCKNGSFQVVSDEAGCRIAVDFEKCKRCGECAHACELGAVKMI